MINRTMSLADFEDPAFQDAANLIIETWEEIQKLGGECSTWWGTLDDEHASGTLLNKGDDYVRPRWYPEAMDHHIPWFTLWEYCWTLIHCGALNTTKKRRFLSLGGAASAFDLTLLRLGHEVVLVEARGYSPVQQARNAALFGRDHMFHAHCMNIADLGHLDIKPVHAMVSTNVIFLAGTDAQAAINTHLQRFVEPGGVAAFTYDLFNPNPKRYVSDPLAQFDWDGFEPEEPSFHDNGERHHVFYPAPEKGKYTAASLLLRRVK